MKAQVLLEEKDALGQVIRTQTDDLDRWDRLVVQRSHLLTPNDTVWSVRREFDARGALVKDDAPSLAGGDTGHRRLTYDALGRVLSEALLRPGEVTYATTSFTYNGLQIAVTDPLLHTTTRHLAAWGPVLRVTDAANGQVNYQYDAFDQLTQATDPAGNLVTRLTYNTRGMRTGLLDMDLGSWSFTPNALGQVTGQTDAKGQSSTFEFDLLGRLKQRTEAEGVSTWTWGTSSTQKNIGRLASVAGPGYGESYAYDSLGRPAVRTIVADASYQFDYAYDSAGRLATLTYPTSTAGVRFKTKYGYAGGHLASVQEFTGDVNGAVLWTLNLLDARRNAVSEAFGNGLWIQNTFDPLTGLPTTRQAGTGGQATNIQQLSYAWDPAGNLTSRQDLRQGLLESFTYDALDRLTLAAGPGAQSTALAYDAIGNLQSKTGVGSYTYHPTRRHAVTSAGGVSYGYDANGNMTSRGSATIGWSSYNLPTSINAPGGYSAQFAYAPDRSRWRQVSSYAGGTETTIYVGQLLEKLTTPVRTHWKHLIATPSGQVQVIRRSDGTSETLYVTTDHLGSTDAVLDAAGNAVLHGSFAVHGERRAGNWQGPPSSGEWQSIANTTRRGYTGHEMLDNLALIHMNGRVLDPALGRFLSADPYIDGPLSTQGWNRYAYVHGRVMSATDPSGFQICKSPCYPTGHNTETITVTGRRIGPFMFFIENRTEIWNILNGPQSVVTREDEPNGGDDGTDNQDPESPQGQEPLPPCTDRFVGDSLAQSYVERHGNNAWNEIRSERDSTVPIAPGTQSEAMRNAEHYLYSYSEVLDNSYNWGPMLAYTVSYNAAKFWTNVAEYYHVANSPWTYSINTTSELKSGIAGANDALFGRPSSSCSVGQ